MTAYLISHLVLAIFNVANSRVDANRILQHKRIYHGINFGAYTLLCVLLCWTCGWNFGVITLFFVSAFCSRQLTFDIPLNIQRGLKWDYVSTAKPPKSITDRIEIRVFGYNGRAPVVCYAVGWVLCLLIKAIL
jgi:hypothetical protein